VLRLRFVIVAKRLNPMRADFGFLDSRQTLLNQAGQRVIEMECTMMMERRPEAAP
jgi:acyl dehydratase